MSDAYIFGTIVGSLIAGTVSGLIPFKLGQKYNQKNLGMIGFFTCVISGFILGFMLAIPVSCVFAFIIYLSRERVILE